MLSSLTASPSLLSLITVKRPPNQHHTNPSGIVLLHCHLLLSHCLLRGTCCSHTVCITPCSCSSSPVPVTWSQHSSSSERPTLLSSWRVTVQCLSHSSSILSPRITPQPHDFRYCPGLPSCTQNSAVYVQA